MKTSLTLSENHLQLLKEITKKEKQEHLASAKLTAETLSKLNVTIEGLPQKCRQVIQQAVAADTRQTPGTESLDPAALGLRHSMTLSRALNHDYEILQLKQRNEALQTKINRNKKVIEGLRRDLEESQRALAARDPGPGNIQEHMRHLRQKVTTYEESCNKARAKFSKLSVPDSVHPKSLDSLVQQLTALRSEELELKERADDVTFTRDLTLKFSRVHK